MSELDVTGEAYAKLTTRLGELVDISFKIYYMQKVEQEEAFFSNVGD